MLSSQLEMQRANLHLKQLNTGNIIQQQNYWKIGINLTNEMKFTIFSAVHCP